VRRNNVKIHTFRIGPKTFIVIKITQRAAAKGMNALAANFINVNIDEKNKRIKKGR
jgi:hypothetical protein